MQGIALWASPLQGIACYSGIFFSFRLINIYIYLFLFISLFGVSNISVININITFISRNQATFTKGYSATVLQGPGAAGWAFGPSAAAPKHYS